MQGQEGDFIRKKEFWFRNCLYSSNNHLLCIWYFRVCDTSQLFTKNETGISPITKWCCITGRKHRTLHINFTELLWLAGWWSCWHGLGSVESVDDRGWGEGKGMMTNMTRELSRDVSKLGISNWESRIIVMDEIAKAAVLKNVHNNTKMSFDLLTLIPSWV